MTSDDDAAYWKRFDQLVASGHSQGEAALLAGEMVEAQQVLDNARWKAAERDRVKPAAPAQASPTNELPDWVRQSIEDGNQFLERMVASQSWSSLQKPASCAHLYQLVGLSVEMTKDLAARIAALEQKERAYRGVWKGSTVYEPGCFVTDKGSLWHCERPNAARPGSDEAQGAWKLAGKAGRWMLEKSQ